MTRSLSPAQLTGTPETGRPAPDWRISDGLVPYPEALATMEARAAAIRADNARELVWLLEHPPLYTAGTSAKPADLVSADRFPVYTAGRGGQYTYHGPGQRVAYVLLDLAARDRDVRAHVHRLETWLIRTLARFDVTAERREGRVGLWVVRADGREDKIAAIGVRVRRWVTFHGVALNVEPDLSHYSGIVPCGIRNHGVTSLRALGRDVSMAAVDDALQATFPTVFGAPQSQEPAQGPAPNSP
ncbi:lipoyl(octanoyl) transferase LipB [Roseospira marina]|uniref:Octanoyltransferase n=1 Tax=Roseospira marina TaxID=140057 RepID=A0A5M6IDZ3_9PROT|nr:lipoyl(octanoyl) transferase LipB [Roseospira marina]KAA5605808.1 lipoyl(octanoyl) transferase LipB [Roseospira marina]MBB4313625.1 lipoyl(octanoyl) transferase [Roseospira marina]MBB5086787.1 lipoyl(octanoyl) transferase [Roseospira marina]